MAKFNRSQCIACKKVFVPDSDDQEHCSFICEHGESRKQIKVICETCKDIFYCYHYNRLYCSIECQPRNQGKQLESKEQKKIRLANEKWLQPKESPKNKTAEDRQKSARGFQKDILNEKQVKHKYGIRKWDFI